MKRVGFAEMSAAVGADIYAGVAPDSVTGVCSASFDVLPGDVFVAIKGARSDGHDHVPEAVARGAAAVITERRLEGTGVCSAAVRDSKKAASVAADFFHGHPSRSFTLTGVTGTNGKTTVCYLLSSVWEFCGDVTGMIGTVTIRCGSSSRDADMTTPDAVSLQKIFSEMRSAGANKVCMEVSSHSICEKRVETCDFDSAVFTNLTPEHLDYHGSIENYADSKKKLFTELLGKYTGRGFSIVNIDDPAGAEIARVCRGKAVLYSSSDCSADVFAEKHQTDADGIYASVQTPWGKLEIKSNLTGGYNLSNMLAASSAALCSGSSPEEVSAALSRPVFVPGRMEKIADGCGVDVFVDYAHTADALRRAICAVRPLCSGELFVVFGCGGDRDTTKRAPMGRAAAAGADVAVITSDNPRTEDPLRIIEDICAGITEACAPRCKVRKITDRYEAIWSAVMSANPGDVVLIAGKGHEKYQIVGTEKLPFDDRALAARFLNQKKETL